MAIRVTCKCGKALSVPDSFAGKKGKCPHCKAVLDIPAKGRAAGGPKPRETKRVEQIEFRCPKTGRRASLPKALAGASVVCPVCGEVHSISQSERLKDFISLSKVVKEEPVEEEAAEKAPENCPSCGKPIMTAKDMCLYCGARLATGSVRGRHAGLAGKGVGTSLSAVASLFIAAAGVGMWYQGWTVAYTAFAVLAVLAGGWAVVAVRGSVRPMRGENLGWASLLCGLVLAGIASVAALRPAPADTRRLEPQENAEGLGEIRLDPDGVFSFRPPAEMTEVAPSFVLGSPDPRAVVGMKGEGGRSVAVLSYYEPPGPRPTESELRRLAHKLTGSKENLLWELVDVGGIETHVIREMRYSENRKTASHVVHVLLHDEPGTVPVEQLGSEFIVSEMKLTPEYMDLMHKKALARGEEHEAFTPEKLEEERLKRIEEERKSGRLSKEEAKKLKAAGLLSEAELRARTEEWAKNIRRVIRIHYIHDLPFDAAKRRRDSSKLIYSYATVLLVEVATGKTTAEAASDKFSEEVQFMAKAMEKLGGKFPLKRRRLRSWFSRLVVEAADECLRRSSRAGAGGSRRKASRSKLTGRMASLARSKAASSGLDKQMDGLWRLDLNLATDEEWVELVMRSVSTFTFRPPDEPAEE